MVKMFMKYETSGLKSQSLAAVQAMLNSLNRQIEPLPSEIWLAGVVLVLSNKKPQVYYCTSMDDCSCPAKQYHPAQRCKHQRKYFSTAQNTTRAHLGGSTTDKPLISANHGSWAGGHNGPVEAF
jgi:hypothetical protein